MFEKRLEELGIALPTPPRPLAAYVPAVLADGVAYTSGQLPVADGELRFRGKVGGDLTENQGREAARLCALNCLSVIRDLAGTLDRVERILKVTGYVNSAAGFVGQPGVVNGASDLLLEIFGEAGRHARAAVGVAELPLGAAVEVDMVVKLRP
ncbi:MAG: RidA family protein [Bacillota bacterium]